MQRRVRQTSLLTTAFVALIAAVTAALLGPSPALASSTPGSNTPGSSPAASRSADDGQLRLNQLQVVGTHNSYHLEATPAESLLRTLVSPDGEKALQYSHPALGTQFANQKVRQIELDVWADPNGGLYAKPLLRTLTFGGAYDPVMKQPGTKVLHIQDIDYHSNCLTFRLCLQAVKTWSDANPAHVPVAVLIEFKDTPLSITGLTAAKIQKAQQQAAAKQAKATKSSAAIPATASATKLTPAAQRSAISAALVATPLPWTTARMDTVDADIRSVFLATSLITPDDVRGSDATLEDAVLTRGWPTLAESRGKTLFLMDNPGAYRDSYLAGHPSLQGRVLFTNSTPGQPDAAFVEENDPTGAANQARIQAEVREGYVVRTRADVDTAQARTNDTSMRDAALASGAQWVSTDYPVPADSARFGTTYAVQIPGNTIARCNPVNAPADCITIPTP
jgi:Phosphoinositide phospholipase C, Ca2+-dependent